MQTPTDRNKNNQEILVDSQWLKVIRENLLLPSGVTIENFYTVERPAYSAIVPIFSNEDVLLVRQYRHGPKKDILNIPMGVLSNDEKPIAAAQRELQEEVGYVSESVTFISTFDNAPSFLRLECHLFLAQDLRERQSATYDQNEQVTVVRLPLMKAIEMVLLGEIRDMTTVIGLFAADRLLRVTS